jgi:uncharacterized RDD family membrane protein YckC
MTQIPAGWYPDPAPQSAPGRQRYWDGQQWTAHVHDPQPVSPPTAPAYPSYPGPAEAYPQAYPEANAQTNAQAQPQAYPQAWPQAPAYGRTTPQRPTTPDGVPLSGWWWRVLAAILDGFISIPLYLVAAVPVIAWQWDELSTWFSDLSDSVEHDTASPPDPALLDPGTGPGLVLVLSLLAASLLYSLVFLRWKQATPGKLVVGLRVRRRDTPDLPWGTILARVGFVAGLSALAQAPLVGWAFALVALLDYLWPLWDRRNQALHDKVARTNVVRPGRPPAGMPVAGDVFPTTDATEAGLPRRW